MLLSVLLLGLLGLGTELLLLQHDESFAQIIAPGLIGLALLIVAWHLLHGGSSSVRALQVTMALFVAAGALGMYFHYGANVEFQREMDPSLNGIGLFWKAVAAKTPPPLAPGAMTQLGLIGLAYTFRHPALGRRLPAGPDGGTRLEGHS
jgi:hypothetical protein